MAFRDSKAEEQYWNPKEIGENIEGNLFFWLKDQYGNKVAVFDSVDKDGNTIKTILPSHKNLRRYYNDWNIGDYIRVELVDIKKLSNQHYMKIYNVQIDDEQYKKNTVGE